MIRHFVRTAVSGVNSGSVKDYVANTFTPHIKGILCATNVAQLSRILE